MRSLIPLVVLPLACAGCGPASSEAEPSPSPSASEGSGADPAKRAGAPDGPIAAPPPAEGIDGLARSNNVFALALYARARAQKGNLAISPLSLSTALAMTWAGARGETAAQMKRVLHLDGTPERVLDVCGKLIADYTAPGRAVILRIANRLFGEKTYTFDQGYLDRTEAALGAPLEPLDFKRAAEEGRQRINAWTAAETQDRIKDLIPPGGVDDETRLVLTNAIYFLGDWQHPFVKELTKPAPFHLTKSKTGEVPTMRQTAHFRFAATGGVKVLEMPYKGGDLAMTLVLPDRVDGLDAVEARLSPAVLDGWIDALDQELTSVALPRFEIDPPSSLALRDTLGALGMPLAFDRDRADFTGIADPPRTEDRLVLSQVFHKAFVKVDEKGTEAAAATAVTMMFGGSMAPAPRPKEFRADHPFLFFVRDLRTGMILFMGRVSDPTGHVPAPPGP